MPEVLSSLTGTAARRTWWVPHNFVIDGEVTTATSAKMFVAVRSGQALSLARVRYSIETGTSATFKLQRNGTDITGLTGLQATTTAATTDPADIVLADLDAITLVVTAVSATPTKLTVMLTLEYAA